MREIFRCLEVFSSTDPAMSHLPRFSAAAPSLPLLLTTLIIVIRQTSTGRTAEEGREAFVGWHGPGEGGSMRKFRSRRLAICTLTSGRGWPGFGMRKRGQLSRWLRRTLGNARAGQARIPNPCSKMPTNSHAIHGAKPFVICSRPNNTNAKNTL